MAFCHILTKLCVKINTIVNFSNEVAIAFQRDIDVPACDKPLSLHIDLTFNPYRHQYRNQNAHTLKTNTYIQETFVRNMQKCHMYMTVYLHFEFGRFKINQYADKVA